MQVYNLRKSKYADQLSASGVANRWNRGEQFVIYTGSSRSLTILESLVHQHRTELDPSFKMMVIRLDIQAADILDVRDLLPTDWANLESYKWTQEIGSTWHNQKKNLILRVPSVIVPQESNYIINTEHPSFIQKIHLFKKENFSWDTRLRSKE